MNDLRNLPRKGKISLFLGDRDDRQLFYFLLIYLLAWTLLVGLLPSSMVLDSVEEVAWSRIWQWGYYKHPPLPSILISGLNHLLGGPSMWVTMFAAQGCNVTALIYVWLLAKRILPHKLAIVAVLITSLIGYHNFSASSFDHNTVSLPFSAAIIYYFYCAIRNPERISTWLILGIAAGLAMLTKYSALLIITGAFVYLILQKQWSNPLVIRGLLASILIFTLALSPHVNWLINNNWLPFTYLYNELSATASRIDILGQFFFGQILPFLPMFFGVFLLINISPRKLIIADALNSREQDDDLRFLFAMLLTPLILALLPPMINGYFLSRNWVSAFFLPTGIVIVKCFFCRYDENQLLQNTRRAVWPIQTVILLAFLVLKVFYPTITGHPVRTNFPSQLLAERASTIWHEHQQQPLAIVIADTWLGSNVLLNIRPEPILLIDNNLVISTWTHQQDIANCGALVLTSIEEKNTSTYSVLFNQAVATGTFTLPWGNLSLEYAWAILPPESGHSTCRFNVD